LGYRIKPYDFFILKGKIKINNYECILEYMVFFVSILNLKIFARVLKCKTLQTQGVQEVIKSINRAKIQVRILRFKFLALPMTFYLTLNKSLSLDFPISKVIIFSLLLSHKNSGRLSLRKLKK